MPKTAEKLLDVLRVITMIIAFVPIAFVVIFWILTGTESKYSGHIGNFGQIK